MHFIYNNHTPILTNNFNLTSKNLMITLLLTHWQGGDRQNWVCGKAAGIAEDPFLQGSVVYAWKEVKRIALSGSRDKHSGVSSCFLPLFPQSSSKRKTQGRKTVQELVWFLLIELTRVPFNWIN